MIDVVGMVKVALKAVIDVIFLFFEIPAMVWFRYVPAPARWAFYTFITVFSIYMIVWAWRHRYDWMHVYNT